MDCVFIRLYCHDKRREQLKGRGHLSWLTVLEALTALGCVDSGPVVRQTVTAVGACGLGCSPHGGQEAEGRGRDLEVSSPRPSVSLHSA
jgi:hypothetical protein